MSSSLIRGKYVICKVKSRTEAQLIEDGAVFQRDGRIVEVGDHGELAARYQPDEVLGSAGHVVIPGFVNGHHHVGLTPLQLGAPDLPLEIWRGRRIASRNVDLYLDTLYSAFEMIESGVTTVQHLQLRLNGPVDRISEAASEVIRAYQDIGMRVSYSYMVMDQNQFVHQADEEFIKRLSPDIAPEIAKVQRAQAIPLEDNLWLFEDLYKRFNQEERVRVQLAPANLHWCSDESLRKLKECSDKYGVPMHMHLLETAYQKEHARRRAGTTAVQHLYDLDVLGPSLTLGHGVWLTENDIDLAAQTGTRICHNASSNLRLRSGIAPLNAFEKRGVCVAMGIDEAGINDDRDMLQEMRLVLHLHREPGMDDVVPTTPQVFRMATEHGARTTPYEQDIGTLEPGKAADMVLMNWKHIAYPYLDESVSVIDAVVYRARTQGVETVLVGGEPILRDGRFTRVNKEDALEELAAALRAPLTEDEKRRRHLSKKFFPHLKRFYDGYLEGQDRDPFYQVSSRH